MQRGAVVLMAAVVAAFVAAIAQAEPTQVRREVPRSAEVSELEKRVAALEKQNAELRRFILVNGDNLTIKAPQTLSLQAGASLDARAAMNVLVKATGEGTFESGSTTRVKGPVVRLNGGAKPVARLGDPVKVMSPASGDGKIVVGSPTVFAD